MARFVIRLLPCVGALLATFQMGIYAQETTKTDATATQKPVKVTVATLTMKGSLPESAGQVGLFGEMEVNLADFIARLDRAANDKSVSALVLKIRNPEIGPGKVRELRDAIQRTRKAGKRVTAQLESAASPDFLVACACDEMRACQATASPDGHQNAAQMKRPPRCCSGAPSQPCLIIYAGRFGNALPSTPATATFDKYLRCCRRPSTPSALQAR